MGRTSTIECVVFPSAPVHMSRSSGDIRALVSMLVPEASVCGEVVLPPLSVACWEVRRMKNNRATLALYCHMHRKREEKKELESSPDTRITSPHN